MRLPRLRFTVRILLLLPPAVVLLLLAVDPLTARPTYWTNGGLFEFDVVDARDKRPIPATVTLIYEGPLAGQPHSGASYTTHGTPYEKYRGMTPKEGYGGLYCVVRRVPRTLIFRRHDLTVTQGVRFTIKAVGYEPFEFAPVDPEGRPLAFETSHPPVFRVELRRQGDSGMPVSWSTRPELEFYEWFTRPERMADESRAGAPGCEGNDGTAAGTSDLRGFTVKPGKFTITVATGVVEAVRTQDVRSPVHGAVVVSSMLRDGTAVKQGQLVCEIDSSRIGARRAEPKVVGKQADEAVALPDPVERYPVHAPADGTVQWGGKGSTLSPDRLTVKPGDTVREGQCNFQLYDPAGPMRVRTEVIEDAIDQIKTGLPARIRLTPFPALVFRGTVREIAPLPNRNSYFGGPRFYDTLVSIDGGPPGPRPGMSAQVEILLNDLGNVLSVPRNAALSFHGEDLAAVKRSDDEERSSRYTEQRAILSDQPFTRTSRWCESGPPLQ